MGRWTPLILMAGGLAILLGTLLGISFPMGGQNTAQVPTNVGSRTSKVLPANINVNSTASGNTSTTADRSNVAQNSNPNTTNDSTSPENTQDTNTTQSNDASQNSKPIQALW